MYSKLLVPLDGSRLSESVLPYVRKFAKSFSAPVVLLYVIEPDPLAPVTEPVQSPRSDIAKGDAENTYNAYLQRIAAGIPKPLSVRASVKTGRSAETIVDDAATEARTLIAMATRGLSGVKRWFLGSVANKVLEATRNPLLLIKATGEENAGKEASVSRVLVPLDGSQLSETALPHASAIAKSLNVPIELFRSYSLPITVMTPPVYPPNPELLTADSMKEATRKYLRNKVDEIKADGCKEASYLVSQGEAAGQIIDAARQAPGTLIVMCTHGRTGIGRWILGSTAHRVVFHSADPVLLVRAE